MRTIVDDIKSILSAQAYERGHSYGRAEVDNIYSELSADFKDVIKRIEALEHDCKSAPEQG